MINNFKENIDQNLSFLKESKLLIAVSGGLDSVILAYLCKDLGLDIALAHCNFNLRGTESDSDEIFVEALAQRLDLEVFIQRFDTEAYAKSEKLSTQMAARELRYDWFNELSEQLDFDYILTAHHADDNLETFLINLSRGSGLEGLTGIPVVNGNIVRPLLPFSRETIEDYAKEQGISWREDSSNASVKYLRNKLRHEVVPILKGINPQLLQNFNKTISNLKESQHIIDDRIDVVSDDIIDVSPNDIQLNIKKIKRLNSPKAYLYELLKDYGFTEWNDVEDLLDAQSGKQILSNTHRLIKDRESLILTEIVEEDITQLSIDEIDKKITTPVGVLHFDEADAIFGKRTNIIFVDKDKLNFPLTIRKWQEGDFFFPLGMKGRKKVSKYFKDEKFSLIDKENTWLLCSGNDIVWIVNHRADDRFKVTTKTQNILKISLD